MKNLISIILAFILILAGCTKAEQTEAVKTNTEDNEVAIETTAVSHTSIVEITHSPTAEPIPTASPALIEPSEEKSMYESMPQPTPVYEPTEEDLAFKQQVISEGKTLAFDMSEWELIDLMCNKLGEDEYLYRLVSYDDYPNELFLRWTRDEPEGLHYTVYILNTENGDIFYRDEEDEKYIVGNTFTADDMEEPFRLSEYNRNWIIEQFIKNILHGELPEGVEVKVEYDGMDDMIISTYQMAEDEIVYLESYWVIENTGRVYGDFTGYVGNLFD